jgi:hypothetical protein
MAGQFLTVGEVRAAVIYRGDLEGIEDRHPTLRVINEINLSIRELRVKLANGGVNPVLTPTSILALPVVEAVSGGGYAEIDWPTAAVSVHGLDVKVGGYWCTVPQGNFMQRRLGPINSDRGDYSLAGEGMALWVVRSLPTATAGTAVAGKIMLFPVPSGGSYVLWYLTEWIDLVLDTDLIPLQESWVQWVLWDTVVKCLIRDVGPQTSAQLENAKQERDRTWSDIRTNISQLANDQPIQPMSRYGHRHGRGPRMIP